MGKIIFKIVTSFLLFCSFMAILGVEPIQVKAQVLANENFSNLNNFTIVSGVWTTSNGILQGISSTGQEGLICTGGSTWMYYQVITNLRIVTAGDEASVVVRYVDSKNYYWLGLGCWNHKYSISKIQKGVTTELASSGVANDVQVGKWYTVAVVAFCGKLELFVDNVKVLEIEDFSFSNGAVGFRTWDGTMQTNQLTVQSLGWSKVLTAGITSSIIQPNDGGYVLMGSINDLYNPEQVAFSLIKTDNAGNLLWSKKYLGFDTYFSSIIQTNDGGYAYAGFNRSLGVSDLLLVKTDSLGNELWNRTYGGLKNDAASALVQTNDGGYAIAGSTTSYGAGKSDFWLLRTDLAGNKLWDKTYGSYGFESANCLVQRNDGGYTLAGYTNNTSAGDNDFWLVKTDSLGNQLWNQRYGGSSNEAVSSLILTSDGGYVLFGSGLLVKTDSVGNQLWSKTYQGLTSGSLIQTSDGGYAFVNSTFLIKTDSNADLQWTKDYEGQTRNTQAPYPNYRWQLTTLIKTTDEGYALAGYKNEHWMPVSRSMSNYFWLVKAPVDVANVIPESSSVFVLSMLMFASFLGVALFRKQSKSHQFSKAFSKASKS